MENDLGDSHCLSLRQGGRTPDNSPNARVVGKIFSEQGTNVSYTVFLGSPGNSLTVEFYDLNGQLLNIGGGMYASFSSASTSISGSFTNNSTQWIAIKVRNTSAATPGQKCYVKVTYDAPEVVNTANFPSESSVFIWTSNGGSSDWSDCRNWEGGVAPVCTGDIVIPHATLFSPTIPMCFTGNLVLPLELLRFDAKARETFIALDWQSAAEHNFAGYELQRSVDGSAFEKIAWVSGKGGAAKQDYQYEDRSALEGILYYYRIKMLDTDGAFKFSAVRSAALGKAWGKPVFTPNPTSGMCSVSFVAPQEGSGLLNITDVSGRKVMEQSIQFDNGSNTRQLDLSALPAGTYFIQLEVEGAIRKWNNRVVITH